MQDARVRAALLIVCLACLLGSGFVLFSGRHAAPPPVVIAPPPEEVVTAASKPVARIYVDVAGAVRRPSLYVLPLDSRVMQAIIAAGGPTANADMDTVNLAQKVTDGERVFVPRRSPETATLQAASPSAPAAFLPAQSSVKAAKGRGSSRSGKVGPNSGEQITLNTATLEQLERLPSVGPGMAGRILAYRQQAGGFQKIEDLQMVTGIGPKKYAKIAPCVKLN